MSRGSRSPAVLILLGMILVAGPADAETKEAGRWTDPPAKMDTPAMNAASPKPAATPAKAPAKGPAKLDAPAMANRPEARPPRRSAKLRRAQIRGVASRTRPARVSVVRQADRPGRRVVARMSAPPRLAMGPARSVRPVYGYIPPDAPAYAYYEQRRVGTMGNGPGDLGLPPEGDPAYRTVGMREGGHLVMRWRRVPAGVVHGHLSPFDPFSPE